MCLIRRFLPLSPFKLFITMKNQPLFYLFLFIILTSCQKKNSSWFCIEQVDNKTYRIRETKSSQGNISYLIVGDKKALLFDSGSGENQSESMKSLVDSLAGVPIILLHSHFHFDHMGNSNDFSSIALPNLPALSSLLDSNMVLPLSEKMTLDTTKTSLKIAKILPLNASVDLGNREIQIQHTAGHSPYSFCIIDKDRKYLFAGDLAYKGLLRINQLNDYQNSLSQLIKTCDSTYQILSAHGEDNLMYSDLDKIKQALIKFQNKRPEARKKIDFLGVKKKMYVIDGIPFIYEPSKD